MNSSDDDHQLLLTRNIDDDTRILRTAYLRPADIPVLLEQWSADGVMGLSAILLARDSAGLDDEALKRLLQEQAGLDLSGPVTICRRDGHTFVNFGFETK